MDVLSNYTPDKIHWNHGGEYGDLEPGKLYEFHTQRANYIVTKFGPRGILMMKYGMDVSEAKKKAMDIWRKFWERQVIIFNQDNERRQSTNREYVHPTEELTQHAEKLGLQLVGPWTIKKTDDASIRATLLQNVELEAKVKSLESMIKDLTEAIKGSGVPMKLRSAAEKVALSQEPVEETEPEPEPEQEEVEAPKASDIFTGIRGEAAPSDNKDVGKLVLEFQMLTKDKFLPWISENAKRLQSNDYPAEVLDLVKKKWAKLFGDKEDWPLAN